MGRDFPTLSAPVGTSPTRLGSLIQPSSLMVFWIEPDPSSWTPWGLGEVLLGFCAAIVASCGGCLS